jgi:protein-tyrosine phosphatase
MAEGLLREALGPAVRVSSAGLDALVGAPPDPEAMRLMKAHGVDIASHRGRQVTPEMALEADLILVMDARQRAWCEDLVPSACGRVFLLGHWLGSPPADIADPYGQGPDAFRLAFDAIRQSVAAWVPHLRSEQRPA